MPSKKKTKHNQSSENSDDECYRKKRDSNNEAVKRSRMKAKQQAKQTEVRVQELKNKNRKLEENIEIKTKNLKLLKELFLAQAQAMNDKCSNFDLKKLLMSDDEDDDDRGDNSRDGSRSQATLPSTSRP